MEMLAPRSAASQTHQPCENPIDLAKTLRWSAPPPEPRTGHQAAGVLSSAKDVSEFTEELGKLRVWGREPSVKLGKASPPIV